LGVVGVVFQVMMVGGAVAEMMLVVVFYCWLLFCVEA